MRYLKTTLALLLATLSTAALSAGPAMDSAEKQPLNMSAIIMFLIFVGLTLGITYWAASRTKSASDFYTAGGGISGFQNGLAIAGDYMSAATLLGLTAMVYGKGYDGYIYMIAFFVGWPCILFLMAERLRNLGRFTFADITSYRLNQGKVRTMAAISSLTVVCFYLIAQMVGAGQLIKLLFGLEYEVAVVAVGALMMVYVTFGGMIATTWVQIIKACLLMTGGTIVMILSMSQFDFSYTTLVQRATAIHKNGFELLTPGGLLSDPITAISLCMGLMFGTAGLPHILVRFYTNPDGVAAKKTTMWVMILIGVFYVFPPIFGVLGRDLLPELYAATGAKGTDKIVLELPRVLNEHGGVWGSVLSGITCAGAFAAFMSTFSGLLVSMTGALAHDVYGRMLRPKSSAAERMFAFKISAVVIGAIAIGLGAQVEQLQINFMVGQAFAIAAASYFPLLFMSVWWRGMTMQGAAIGMLGGGLAALACTTIINLSDLKIVDLAAFWKVNPLLRILCEQPAIWTVPLAIGLMIGVSKLTAATIPSDIRMKMLVLHAPEKLGLKQEYIQEHSAGAGH